MLRKVGLGWRICFRTGCDSWARRERGICTRDKDTGRRETVTCMELNEWENAVIVLSDDGIKKEPFAQNR